MKKLITPLTKEAIASLKAGEEVLLSGTIYTARDQAHLRLSRMIEEGKELPLDLEGQVIYYCGPTPAPEGKPIGSCGPTTSSRMDKFTPAILEKGLKGMIGKGTRGESVVKAIKDNGAVYFLAPAGAGAYLAARVSKCEPVAFEDLGPEAIYRLEVSDFPLVVGVDARGNDIYNKI
jgi:fumarate hydratase subunit beta